MGHQIRKRGEADKLILPSVKRIAAKDHIRLALPVVYTCALLIVLVLLYLYTYDVTLSSFRTFFLYSALGIYVSPLLAVHFQYWLRNKRTGVKFDGSVLRIYSDEIPIQSILLDDEVDVEKVVGREYRTGSFLPYFWDYRCFVYYIWRAGERHPVILTSLLVGECPVLDEIARKREKWLPWIDVETPGMPDNKT